jgi:hypothetical protein
LTDLRWPLYLAMAGFGGVMDDLERRLAAAATRVHQNREQAAAEAGQAEARQQQIAKLRAAIGDWKSRISPAIDNAVARANEVLAGENIRLVIVSEETIVIGGGGAEPRRPKLIIGVVPRYEVLHIGRNGQLYRPLPTIPRQHVQVGLGADARITVHSQEITIAGRQPVEHSAFSDGDIRWFVADIVDALVPPRALTG